MVRVDIVFKHYNNQLQILRGRVLRAFLHAGIEPHWHEWDLRQKNLPPIIASKGALTVLVNGVDVLNTGSTLLERFYCFIGFFDGGGDYMPSTARISHVLKEQKNGREGVSHQAGKFNLWLVCSTLPLLVLSFFADTLCVQCGRRLMSLQGGTMSADIKYIIVLVLPVVVFSLFLALGVFLYRAKERHGYKPLMMATLGLIMIFYGHVLVTHNVLYLGGVVLVLFASGWNAHGRTFQALHDCPRCPVLSHGPEVNVMHAYESQVQKCPRDLLAFNQFSR